MGSRFQVFSPPFRGAFHLSLTVLVHYRSPRVFRLGGWSPQLPTGFLVPRGTRVVPWLVKKPSPTGLSPSPTALSRVLRLTPSRILERLGPFHGHPHNPQETLAPRPFGLLGLGSAPSARRYSGHRVCFLFLGVLRCFSSPGSPPWGHSPRDDGASYAPPGFPIRASRAPRARPLPRAFRCLAAPFFGPWHLGIHREPSVPSPLHGLMLLPRIPLPLLTCPQPPPLRHKNGGRVSPGHRPRHSLPLPAP